MAGNRGTNQSFFQDTHAAAESHAGDGLTWKDLALQTKLQLSAIYGAKVAAAFAWAGSFSIINKAGSDLFWADMIPFWPQALENMTLADTTSLTLGILAVVIPSIAFHFILKYPDILRDPQSYFDGQIERILVAVLISSTWIVTIALEVLSLKARMDVALNNGPLPILGDVPEFWPLAFVSAALILASSLLGLASAALGLSISRRNKALHSV